MQFLATLPPPLHMGSHGEKPALPSPAPPWKRILWARSKNYCKLFTFVFLLLQIWVFISSLPLIVVQLKSFWYFFIGLFLRKTWPISTSKLNLESPHRRKVRDIKMVLVIEIILFSLGQWSYNVHGFIFPRWFESLNMGLTKIHATYRISDIKRHCSISIRHFTTSELFALVLKSHFWSLYVKTCCN